MAVMTVGVVVAMGLCVSSGDALGTASDADPAPFRPEDIGVGVCVPNPVVVTHLVDCRFPLSVPVSGSAVAQALATREESGSEGQSRSWPCRVEDGGLVCERLMAMGVGDLEIDVDVDGSVAADRAFVTVLPYSIPAEIRIEGQDWGARQIQVVAAGHLVDIEVRRRSTQGPVWLSVRAWPERSEVESLRLLSGTEAEATVQVRLGEAGQYEFVLCVGDQPDACVEDASGRRLQVIDTTVDELVPGHNLAGSDRVNLVITGGGWESVDRLAEVARVLFHPDAEPILSRDGSQLWWPPFTVEPLASNGYRFNLWLLPDQIDLPGIVQGDGVESKVAVAFELEDASFIHLQADPVLQGGIAELPSFWQSVTVPHPTDEVLLGSANQFIDPAEPFAAAQGIAHELGHSLFGLMDEYQRDALAPKLGPPNCAEDQVQANNWWGDLVDDVDPQLATYRSALQRHGLWTDQMEATLEDDLTVGFIDGWYRTIAQDAVIPTRRSLMNDNIPVFGSVNRRYAELVLQKWAGTAALTSEHLPDALTADCTNTAATTHCQFAVAPLLTKPTESIRIRIGEDSTACSFTPAINQDTSLITCPTVDRQGDILEASVNNGPWIKLADLTPSDATPTTTPAPPTSSTTNVDPVAAASSDGSNRPTATIWATLIILGVVAAAITTRQIRKHSKDNNSHA
jgi:hypothetical protein